MLSFCFSLLPVLQSCSFFSSHWWIFFFADCHFSSQVAIWLFLPSSRCICRLASFLLLSPLDLFLTALSFFFSLSVSLQGILAHFDRQLGWANDRLPGPLTHICRGQTYVGACTTTYVHVNPDERLHCSVPCEKRTAALPVEEVSCWWMWLQEEDGVPYLLILDWMKISQ